MVMVGWGKIVPMARVIFRKADYRYETLKSQCFEIIDSAGGGAIRPGSLVLIKPNLLAPAPPESAMLTHPMLVKAAVEYVLQKGGRPQVSDSPAMGSFAKVLEASGIEDALKGLDVKCVEFKESDVIKVGEPFRKIEIAKDALRADFVINLPKLKSHSQMLLTLGVKNLYGCVVGLRKPEWHFRTGVNREMFARLLVQIWGAVKPSVTVLDGVLAMEGQGPGKGGTPKQIGVLIGSNDAVALDIAVCMMLGIDPDDLLTNRIAREMGYAEGGIEIDGDVPRVRNFVLPGIAPLVFGPERLHGFMRRHLVQRPESDSSICRLCGECWRYCPAGAIRREKKGIRFDYDKCIRCYCCIEVCPHAALTTKETITGRIVRGMLRKRD
jgi:uncharacterized protein (DUF362 family)/Pyruvate/2-oxoacid:ferredoxin oxidoreductase delta subunit